MLQVVVVPIPLLVLVYLRIHETAELSSEQQTKRGSELDTLSGMQQLPKL